MNLKFVLKALSFSLATSLVYASNDCDKIKEYLEKKSLNYEKIIEKCSMNDEGNVIGLKINNEDLQEEDVNKILSYDTLKDLEYTVVFNFSDVKDTPYSNVLLPHPGFSGFPSVITDLPELENLIFNYNNFRRVKYFPEIKQISIEDGFLKLSKKLKKLTLSQVSLTSQNLKELSDLSNLKELELNYSVFDNDGFNSFENHENLSKLTINNMSYAENVIPNNINKIKPLKQLYIYKGYCNESSYNFDGLENLESLYLDISKACNFDLSKLNKLSELSIKGPNDMLNKGISSTLSLALPNNLKKLDLSYLSLSSDNYKAVSSLPNLEELTIIYYNTETFNIKSFECHDKLRKLIINPMYSSGNFNENLDFLNNLVNINYLDLSSNEITEIPQLENLTNLKHINLSHNKLSKFPKELTVLKQLEYVDLKSNAIYDKLPESLSQLENLKYFDVYNNKKISGKVLINQSLEKCGYSSDDSLCIPVGYELKCSMYNNDLTSFKTCEEDNNEESTNGQCGENHGKCPSGQCCNKDGQCGTTEDYCLVTKKCQIEYGDCKDECEEIYDQLRKLDGNKVNSVKCTANEKGNVQSLVIKTGDQTYIDQLENITELESLTLDCHFRINNFKPLSNNEKLSSLIISGYCYGDDPIIPEDILNLKSLRRLEIPSKYIKSIPSNIKNLKNLEHLNLRQNSLQELPDEFSELENLKILDLEMNDFELFPKQIANLKNLENLNLSGNDIDDKIPESYNDLSKLKIISLSGNKNIEGKALQNEKLVTCEYNYDWELISLSLFKDIYSVCRSGNEKCLSELSVKAYPLCNDSSTNSTVVVDVTTTASTASSTSTTPSTTTTTTTTTINTTTNTTNTATSTTSTTTATTTNTSTSTTTNSTTTTTTNTSTSTTTNSTTTTTTNTSTSTNSTTTVSIEKTTSSTTTTNTTTTTSKPSVEGSCGKGIGKCSSGYCCSKYGWCGKSDDYCAISKGCQSEFGDCKATSTTTANTTTTTTKTSTTSSKPTNEGRCGEGIGSCPTGQCCSKYGWCGKSYNYCAVSEGCQSKFGYCSKDNTSIEGRCGDGYGKCPSGQCCSKYGWCGNADAYCAVSKGCQSKFGKCE